MKKVRLLLFFGILGFIYSCSGGHKHFYRSPLVQKDFSIQKVDSFTIHNTAKKDYTIGKLRFSFAINKNDSLFAFYDEIKRSLVVVNYNGVILHVISHKGRGPGELIKVGGYNLDKNNQLVVYDESQRLIKVFNLHGQILQVSKIKKSLYPIIGFKLYPFHRKIYSATANLSKLSNFTDPRSTLWKSKLASVYNYQGSLIDTVGRYDPSVQSSKDSNIFSIIYIDKKNKRLLSTHWYNYRIQVYDLNKDKRIAWFGRKTFHFKVGDKFISPKFSRQKMAEMAVGRSTPRRLFVMDNMIMLYFENLTKSFFDTNDFNQKKPYLAVYDKETHACFGDIKLPYILGSVTDHKLYLIEDSNPDHFTVGVYEIRQGK